MEWTERKKWEGLTRKMGRTVLGKGYPELMGSDLEDWKGLIGKVRRNDSKNGKV